MVTNVITVGPDSSVRDVADILLKHRISALPVVDKHGKLIGIISEGDLARRAELGVHAAAGARIFFLDAGAMH